MTVLTFLLIGLTAGVLSGLFGIGGGVVIVPALILLAKMQPHMAIGTSLGALLLPVGALGAITYYRSGNVDVRASLLLAGGVFVGALFGAVIAHGVAPLTLRRMFAVFLVAMAVRLWVVR
jgi:uncharacterized membrane protein YfcA